MPKINQEEYEILKKLDDKWKWIARDENRGLYAFTKKPVRKDGPSSYWWDADGWDAEPYAALGLVDEIHLFQFIQWEDEEPYNIAELIREYEKHEFVKINHEGQERLNKLFGNESEEKEMKDIEWLRKEFDDLFNGKSILTVGKSVVDEIINQLDEPETLSQEWIEEHKESWKDLSVTGYSVPEKDLQNLLVPKLEKVDKAYKEGYDMGKEHGYEKGYSAGVSNNTQKPEFTIYDAHDKIREESTLTDKSFDYYWNCIADGVEIDEPGNLLVPRQEEVDPDEARFNRKVNKIIKAIENPKRLKLRDVVEKMESLSEVNQKQWLDRLNEKFGEIEQEPKYYVMNNDQRMMLVRMMDGKTIAEADPFKIEDMYENEKEAHRLTEQEIKDYDPRYWAFAEPVEEVKE